MDQLSRSLGAIAIALLGASACYSGGEPLDLDLATLDRVEFHSIDADGNRGDTFAGWLARTPRELATGLAFVEGDRLTPAEGGRIPAMVYLRAAADPPPSFKQRLVATDVLALAADGTVQVLGSMPALPTFDPETRVFIEALSGRFAAAGVREGTRLRGLEAIVVGSSVHRGE